MRLEYVRIEKDGKLVISIAVKNGGMMPAIPAGCTVRIEYREIHDTDIFHDES